MATTNGDSGNVPVNDATAKDYGKILKYIGLFGGVQFLQVLMSVVRNKCAAVFIGRVGMGITDVLNRTTDMFSALTNLGIPLSGVRKISAEHNDCERLHTFISTVRLWSVLTGLIGTLLCASLSGFVNEYLFAGAIPRGFLVYVSPVVFFMSVYGGETAILKGTRNLKHLAAVSTFGTFVSLVITVLLYVFFGIWGVPFALLAGTIVLACSTVAVTHRLYPWHRSLFTRSNLLAGKALLAIGISYVAAGFAGTGAEMLVRAFIAHGTIGDVGLYASGFVLCVTYTRIVFVAMDADYFPRLSATKDDCVERNRVVSNQIDVCVLLMAPMLVVLLVFLPLVISVLYTHEFSDAVGMCLCATGYLFVKAIIAPVEYIPLAKGDSVTYFVVELVYDLFFVAAVAVGYRYGRLEGAGMALTVSYLFDLAMVTLVYRRIYGFAFNRCTLGVVAVQGVIVAAAFCVFKSGYGLPQYIVGAILAAVSAFYSVKKLKITWNTICRTFRRKKVD